MQPLSLASVKILFWFHPFVHRRRSIVQYSCAYFLLMFVVVYCTYLIPLYIYLSIYILYIDFKTCLKCVYFRIYLLITIIVMNGPKCISGQ